MIFRQLKFLQFTVFITLSLLIPETLYASQLMVSNAFCPAQTHTHSPDNEQLGYLAPSNAQTVSACHHEQPLANHHQQDQTSNHCSQCGGHCLACFNLIPSKYLQNSIQQHTFTAQGLLRIHYISYISTLPLKPPII